MIELVLKLDPVQAERVKEALKHVHHEQHREGNAREQVVPDEDTNEAVPATVEEEEEKGSTKEETRQTGAGEKEGRQKDR